MQWVGEYKPPIDEAHSLKCNPSHRHLFGFGTSRPAGA
uniref:Uncharacterized protein n=1 Tax=Anguilla anguilla TaxID=7936 RepID=A0A0E9PVT2_ANGAN